MNTAIPILTYHQVAPNPQACYPLQSVEPKTFARQMRLLKLLGYNSIDLDQLYEYRNGNYSIPKNPIVITFDDGYQESVDNSIDVLESYGFTAIYFVPTDYIGGSNKQLKQQLGFDLPIIGWAGIKQLYIRGFQVGCHSMSHPHLDQISKDECVKELKNSKEILEENIGCEVKHLAYPFGSYNETVISAADETGFQTACTIEAGLCKTKYDRLALPRINIGQQDSILDFLSKIHTGFNPQRGARILFKKALDKFILL